MHKRVDSPMAPAERQRPMNSAMLHAHDPDDARRANNGLVRRRPQHLTIDATELSDAQPTFRIKPNAETFE